WCTRGSTPPSGSRRARPPRPRRSARQCAPRTAPAFALAWSCRTPFSFWLEQALESRCHPLVILVRAPTRVVDQEAIDVGTRHRPQAVALHRCRFATEDEHDARRDVGPLALSGASQLLCHLGVPGRGLTDHLRDARCPPIDRSQ